MKLINTIIAEAIAIFIDDGAFALAIVACLLLVAALVRFVPDAAPLGGLALFIGLAGILVESATRRARKTRW